MIGVGSLCFGAATMHDLLYYKDVLAGSTVALVDVDREKLSLMEILVNKMNAQAKSPFKIKAEIDRRRVLEGADFVILSPAIKREELWQKDWEIINGAGIKQTYGENGGPGALSHTLRNVPLILSIARDIEKLAPRAWVINYTNPEARICMLLDRYTRLKFIGLCHQIGAASLNVSKTLDIPENDIDIKAAGLNHFTWIYDLRRKSTGEDVYPEFKKKISKMPDDFEPLSRKMLEIFGLFPTPGDHHLAEFLAMGWEFQGLHGRNFKRCKKTKEINLAWLRGIIDGSRKIEEKVKGKSGERVADMIVAMLKNGNSYELSVDIRNGGCIPNLPSEAVVEVPGLVSGDGVRGLKMGPLPEGIAALARKQITVQELAVAAAVKGDRNLALQALILDPVVDSLTKAEKVLDKIINAHQAYISPAFFKKRPH